MQAFDAAYQDLQAPDWLKLAGLIEARAGKRPSDEWLAAMVDEGMVALRLAAPRQDAVWTDPSGTGDDSFDWFTDKELEAIETIAGCSAAQGTAYSVALTSPPLLNSLRDGQLAGDCDTAVHLWGSCRSSFRDVSSGLDRDSTGGRLRF